jgi:hypothetical protein
MEVLGRETVWNDLNGAKRLNGLERLEPALFDEHQGSQSPRGLKKGNKKNFSQERLCLLTCLL